MLTLDLDVSVDELGLVGTYELASFLLESGYSLEPLCLFGIQELL